MDLTQVLCAICFLVGTACVNGFGVGGFGGGYGGSGGYGGGYGGSGGYEGGHSAPKPYDFGYVANDNGGAHFRTEKGDSSGNVQGSYGYTDSQGLQRKVEYLANAGGFRASVKTNEPGTDGKEDPADVQMHVQPPPHGVQGGYSSGFGSQRYGGAGFGGGKSSHYY